MTTQDILLAIANGEMDEHFDILHEALRSRSAVLASLNTSALKAGDTVRFSDTIRPKYLVGREAMVVKRNAKSVIVSCPNDPAYGRFCGLKNVRCPNSLIAGLA